MWKKFAYNAVIPALFVLVGTLAGLSIADRAEALSTEHKLRIEAERKLHEELLHRNQISQYDQIFKEISEQYDIDWKLLAAIARSESEFRFDAISYVGAIGLMQIMPHVARSMGYKREELFDPRTNVEIAAKLFHENESMLHLPEELDDTERLRFILGCYNAGYPRIADARRLAQYFDADANIWSIVSLFLSWLSDPEFSELEVVQSGTFCGSRETISYVEKVIHIYNLYRSNILM